MYGLVVTLHMLINHTHLFEYSYLFQFESEDAINFSSQILIPSITPLYLHPIFSY